LHPDTPAESIVELAEDLKRQVDHKSGKSLINAIYSNEVFGEGPYVLNEPHLLLPNEGITFRMDLGSKWFWNEASRIRGTHQKHGVLYAYGSVVLRLPMLKYMILFQLYYAAWDCPCRMHLMGAC
jgi:hypothetical protein